MHPSVVKEMDVVGTKKLHALLIPLYVVVSDELSSTTLVVLFKAKDQLLNFGRYGVHF